MIKLSVGQKIALGLAGVGGFAGLMYLLSRAAEAELPQLCTPDTFEVIDYCADERTPKRVRKCQPDGTWKEELYTCPFIFTYIITIEGLDIPIYWTTETGKPEVEYEYKDSLTKQVSGEPRLCNIYRACNQERTVCVADRLSINDGAGVYIICNYPDGTKLVLTPTGYVFINNQIKTNVSDCVPQTVPIDYTNTDACTKTYDLNIAFGTIPTTYTGSFCNRQVSFLDTFWFTPLFYEHNEVDEVGTSHTLTKTATKDLTIYGYQCVAPYIITCYTTAKFGNATNILNFLKYKYEMENYLNLPNEAEMVGHLKNFFDKETEEIANTLKSWYYRWGLLAYLYAGYKLPEEGV